MLAVAAFVFGFGIAGFIAPRTADYKLCCARVGLGAQAASVSFSAACRKAYRTLLCAAILQPAGVVGKLPTTTGWQPVLPRVRLYTRERRRPALREYLTGL